ncbi:MAG: hypothetical protein KAV87_42020 [Desulfobacteraceae bacterium]|nr:hypothetical protein [Desulfobacteraceae bacterium]
MIFSLIFLLTVPLLNPHLGDLIKSIRHNDLTHADSHWNQYTTSLTKERYFSEKTQHLGGLHNIKEHEVKFTEGLLTEAEFCHQIGLDFSKEIMPMESKWFLNKAESLGFVDATTYFARARNYATEWNNILHYNEDLSDPMLKIYENKWRENTTKFIQHSSDSADIYGARLKLTSIYWPFRTPIFIDSFAPITIENIQNFINEYPDNPLIERAYERLVWWLYTTKKYTRLRKICQDFLYKYPDSNIKGYIKFQLGNAYYFTQEFDEAKKIFLSIGEEALPHSVYPGWGGQYIFEELKHKLKELEDKD